MNKKKLLFFIFFQVFAFVLIVAQSVGDDYSKEVLRKEQAWGINLNSNGYGLSYRYGKEKTIFRKNMLEFEFSIKKDPKEIRAKNPFYANAKNYVYGKMNRLNTFHAGVGYQKVLNFKPYWGGTEIRYILFGGASLGMSSPVYLYIIDFYPDTYETKLTTERYDPDLHNIDNIYGNGPFAKGLLNITPHAGLYAKFGLNFEFGEQDRTVRALETGVNIDAFLNPVEIMAYNNSQHLFFSFFLSFHFGSRKDYY